MKARIAGLALALFSSVVLNVSAQETPSRDAIALQEKLQHISSLQGQFEQEVLAESGKLVSASSGSFKLLQPGYFFWRITAPDEQILIAAGDSLWHYDVELETATRRDITADKSQSPLSVLSASAERLHELYTVQRLSDNEYHMVPRFEGAPFSAVALTLAGEVPGQMKVTDHLQQVTHIRFVDVSLNPHLLADEFTFIPPDGVDVYVNER